MKASDPSAHVVFLLIRYLTPPSVGGDGVHDGLQAEGVIAFIAHVTHQHLRVLPGVPKAKTTLKTISNTRFIIK